VNRGWKLLPQHLNPYLDFQKVSFAIKLAAFQASSWADT